MIFQFIVLFVQLQVLFAYQIGTGIYDMTGPSVGITFMGYALPTQVGSGIHLRLKARAFVFRDGEDDTKLVAYVNMDTGMGSDIVRIKAIEMANQILGKEVFSTVRYISYKNNRVYIVIIMTFFFSIIHYRIIYVSVVPTLTQVLEAFFSTFCTRSVYWDSPWIPLMRT